MPFRFRFSGGGGGGGGFRRAGHRASHIPFSCRPEVTGADLSGNQGHTLVAMMMARDGDLHTFRVGGHTWHLALNPDDVHQSGGGFVGLRRLDDLLRSRPSDDSRACIGDLVKMEDIETAVHPMAASTATMSPYIR